MEIGRITDHEATGVVSSFDQLPRAFEHRGTCKGRGGQPRLLGSGEDPLLFGTRHTNRDDEVLPFSGALRLAATTSHGFRVYAKFACCRRPIPTGFLSWEPTLEAWTGQARNTRLGCRASTRTICSVPRPTGGRTHCPLIARSWSVELAAVRFCNPKVRGGRLTLDERSDSRAHARRAGIRCAQLSCRSTVPATFLPPS